MSADKPVRAIFVPVEVALDSKDAGGSQTHQQNVRFEDSRHHIAPDGPALAARVEAAAAELVEAGYRIESVTPIAGGAGRMILERSLMGDMSGIGGAGFGASPTTGLLIVGAR